MREKITGLSASSADEFPRQRSPGMCLRLFDWSLGAWPTSKNALPTTVTVGAPAAPCR